MADESTLEKRSVKNINYNDGDLKNHHKVNYYEKLKACLCLITVEPVLILYTIPAAMISTITPNYNMEKACKADLKYSEEICTKVVNAINDNITRIVLQETQDLYSSIYSWQSALERIFPTILLVFIGGWSDKTGNRKLLMIMPIIAEIVSTTGLIMATYYFDEWPLWSTGLIQTVPSVLCGGLLVLNTGAYSYLADVTSVSSRTSRMGFTFLVVSAVVYPLTSQASARLLNAIGYYGIYTMCIVIYLLALIYTCLKIQDVRKTELDGGFKSKLISFFDVRHVIDTVTLLTSARGKKLVKLLLLIGITVLRNGANAGESVIEYQYFQYKFSSNLEIYQNYITYAAIVNLVGQVLVVVVLVKIFKVQDSILGVLNTVGKIIQLLIYCWAPNLIWMYVGKMADLFETALPLSCKAISSKIVELNEIGKITSLLSLAYSLTTPACAPIYLLIYTSTRNFPGAAYLFGAITTSPCIILFGMFYIIDKKEERDAVKNPTEKELYAHENAITSL